MTEQEWLACTDLSKVIQEYGPNLGPVSKRKIRLTAYSVCRLGWWHIYNSPIKKSLKVAELFADGLISEEKRQSAWNFTNRYNPLNELEIYETLSSQEREEVNQAFLEASLALSEMVELIGTNSRNARMSRIRCDVFREMFGNPFRPVFFDSSWQTTNAIAIAQTIYAKRRFKEMPILADALEDAGCTSDELLSHCRNGKTHFRGCWALDLVLGKN